MCDFFPRRAQRHEETLRFCVFVAYRQTDIIWRSVENIGVEPTTFPTPRDAPASSFPFNHLLNEQFAFHPFDIMFSLKRLFAGVKRFDFLKFPRNPVFCWQVSSRIVLLQSFFNIFATTNLISAIWEGTQYMGAKCPLIGGRYRSRTDDLPDASGRSNNLLIVENIGVEPTTSCMPCKRSSQLS